MIINKVNIIAFGGLKNKVIVFDTGINLIYGENEAGKSTIQNFIKVWLYGFANTRTKNISVNERLKYLPISGENISGELHLEYKGKQYLIKRTFGKTKKDDSAIIINLLTGEEVKEINPYESGKYFLGINRETFTRTLFIGQLEVGVKKDKEEEILDKISAVLDIGDGNITIDKSFGRIEKFKKDISNVRKTGKLDLLNEKYSSLCKERYEGYKLSESNINNENELIRLKAIKESLNKEIDNLEVYKKYLKKSKLQKEYEELTSYLRKKEELEAKEKSISNEITFNSNILTEEFLNEIRDEYNIYSNLLNLKNEDLKKCSEYDELIQSYEKNENLNKYLNASANIRIKIERLKIKQEALKEKAISISKLKKEIRLLEKKKLEGKSLVSTENNIGDIKEEIENNLKKYENKLFELKNIAENNIDIKVVILLIIIGGICGSISALVKSIFLKMIFLILPFLSAGAFLVNKYILKWQYNSKIKSLNNEISEIEDVLKKYMISLKVSNYNELYKKLKLYNEYEEFEKKINEKIDEKKYQIKFIDGDKFNEEYLSNQEEINKLIEQFKTSNLDFILAQFDKFDEEINNYKLSIIQKESLIENIDKINYQLNLHEEKIKEKLAKINQNNIELIEVPSVLSELQEKIQLREDVKRSLYSIEQTYSIISKDKNITIIKEELKDIINVSFKYSYEKEEQIDEAVKKKSKSLIDTEKRIRDLENQLNNRFIGNRKITEIEEEIIETKDNIAIQEKNLKASELALNVLKESYEEIRASFGPKLNQEVSNIFNNLSAGNYSEVMVSDKYEMKVKKVNELLSAEHLSNGANDQLYLALRLAFIKIIFDKEEVAIFLDDAFIQYDDLRTKYILKYLTNEEIKQSLIFTCQNRERSILNKINKGYNYIEL